MRRLFAETGDIQLKELTLVQAEAKGDAARVRVRVELAGTDKRTGKPHPAFGKLNRVLELAREDGAWKVRRYGPAEEDLATQLLAAKDKEGRDKLYHANKDLLGTGLVLAMLRLSQEFQRGRVAEAVQLNDWAFEIAEGLADKVALAWCHLQRGRFQFARSRYGEALTSFKQALALFRMAKDRVGEGSALVNIGNVYYSTGRYAEALRHFQDGLKISRELGDRAGEANALRNIGSVYASTGRYAEALRHHQDSLKISRELGDRAGEANVRGYIGRPCAAASSIPSARKNSTAS
jgi:tetratricopeptide (TPR) repeat protein